jgi:hypothetical protein
VARAVVQVTSRCDEVCEAGLDGEGVEAMDARIDFEEGPFVAIWEEVKKMPAGLIKCVETERARS